MLEKLKDNLRTKLSTHIVAAVFISFAVFFTACFAYVMHTNLNIIRETSRDRLLHQSNSLSSQLDNYLMAKADLLGNIAENEGIISLFVDENGGKKSDFSRERAKELLDFYDEIDSDISTIWIASDSGKYAIGSESGYTALSTDGSAWYKPIVTRSIPGYVWYGRQESGFDGVDSIQVVTGIFKNGHLLGYAGLDIPVTQTENIVARFRYDGTTYPIIVGENGSVIYRDDPFGEDGVSDVISDAVIMGKEYQRFEDGGVTHYAASVTGRSKWTVVLLMNGQQLYEKYFNLFVIQTGLYLIGLGVMFLIFRFFIRYELRDLKKIMSAVQSINDGSYQVRINSKSSNELKTIADTLDDFSEAIKEKNTMIESYNDIDKMTGLYNKDKLHNILGKGVSDAEEDGTKLAVVFIDLDNFKWINDTKGHKFGDEVLKAFSSQLVKIVGNKGYCGRFGGDEFVIILPFMREFKEIEPLVEKIEKASAVPLSLSGVEFYVKYSMGVSIFPDDDSDGENVLRNADIAANKAKERGKDRLEYYSFSEHSSMSNKTSIAQLLNSALDNGELYLNYQPIVSTKTGRIYGFEALIRWKSSELGQLPPQEFISIAEETGMILPIGTWIFETACRFTKKLVTEMLPDVVMSINVSPQQLRQPGFVEYVRDVIEITGVPVANLQIEITESLLIDGVDTAKEILQRIREMGLRVALDDFGTGYCSFNYLKELPITSLKIDKTFVNEIISSNRDFNIIGSIIELVHHLGIKTIAEGVESKEQYDALNNINCDYIQGYVVGRPLDEDVVTEFVEKNIAEKGRA